MNRISYHISICIEMMLAPIKSPKNDRLNKKIHQIIIAMDCIICECAKWNVRLSFFFCDAAYHKIRSKKRRRETKNIQSACLWDRKRKKERERVCETLLTSINCICFWMIHFGWFLQYWIFVQPDDISIASRQTLNKYHQNYWLKSISQQHEQSNIHSERKRPTHQSTTINMIS